MQLAQKAYGAESLAVANQGTVWAEFFQRQSEQLRQPYAGRQFSREEKPTVQLSEAEKRALELFTERTIKSTLPFDEYHLEGHLWQLQRTQIMREKNITDLAADQALQLWQRGLAIVQKVAPHDVAQRLEYLYHLEAFFAEQGRLQELLAVQQQLADLQAQPRPRKLPLSLQGLAWEKQVTSEHERKVQTLLQTRKQIPLFDEKTGDLKLWRPDQPAAVNGAWVTFNVQDLLPEPLTAEDLSVNWTDIEFRAAGEQLLVGVRARYGTRPLLRGQFGEIDLHTGTVQVLAVVQHARRWDEALPLVRKPHQHKTRQERKAEGDTVLMEQSGDKTGSAISDTADLTAWFKVETRFERKRSLEAMVVGGSLSHDLVPTESRLRVEIYEHGRRLATQTLARQYRDWGSSLFWEPEQENYRPMSWLQVGSRPVLLIEDVNASNAEPVGAFVMYIKPARLTPK